MLRMIFALLCAVQCYASHIDCTLAGCGLGGLIQTMTSTNQTAISGVTINSSTRTDIYQLGGIYGYVYTVTEASTVPVQIPSLMLYTRSADISSAIDYGIVTDISTAGVADCTDTGGVGCRSGIWGGASFDGAMAYVDQALGWQFGQKNAIAVGFSNPQSDALSNTVAFYITSRSAPDRPTNYVDLAFFSAALGGTGVGITNAAIIPMAVVPESGTPALLLTALPLFAFVRPRSSSR